MAAAAGGEAPEQGAGAARAAERREGIRDGNADRVRIAEAIAASGCTNPVHCIQRHMADLRKSLGGPVRTGLWHHLTQEGFFESGEDGDPPNARRCRERVKLDALHAVDSDRVQNLLDMVEEKTRKLPPDRRYDHGGPLVIFLYALAQSEDKCDVEFSEILLRTISTPHDCTQHAQAEAQEAAAPPPLAGGRLGGGRRGGAEGGAKEGGGAFSLDDLMEMDDARFGQEIIRVLGQADGPGFNSKEIARCLQGLDLDKGMCHPPLKNKVNRILDKNDTMRKQVQQCDPIQGKNMPQWKLREL